MKVNYLLKNRLKHPYFKRILVLMVIFISGWFFFYFFSGVIISIISPIWKAKNIITMGDEIPPTLNEQNQRNILLELVGRRLDPEMIISAVLTHPPQTPYDFIIIDAGSNEHVAMGAEVFLPDG